MFVVYAAGLIQVLGNMAINNSYISDTIYLLKCDHIFYSCWQIFGAFRSKMHTRKVLLRGEIDNENDFDHCK